jgi:cytochrome c1
VIAIPLILLGLVVAHIIALHEVGSNNPDGVEIKANKDANGIPLDGIPFHPYYTVHDLMGVVGFLILFSAVVFFAPEMGGYFLEYNNFIPADSLKTPPHIAPVWYFTPFYSMLRATTDDMLVWFRVIVAVAALWRCGRASSAAGQGGDRRRAVLVLIGIGCFKFTGVSALAGCDAKFWGVLVMGGSVVILFFMPWLDQSPVKSIRYRPGWHKAVYGVFVVTFLILGYLGIEPPDPLKNGHVAGRHADLLRLLPADAVVEPDGHVQARAGSRHLPRALIAMKKDTLMKRFIASLVVALAFCGAAFAQEGGPAWDKFPTERLTDQAALQHGAKLFVNYCLNCHQASYMRYNRLHDIGLTDDQIKSNLLFAGDKVGDLMKTSLDPKDAKAFFGTVPPDLSVITRSRSGPTDPGRITSIPTSDLSIGTRRGPRDGIIAFSRTSACRTCCGSSRAPSARFLRTKRERASRSSTCSRVSSWRPRARESQPITTPTSRISLPTCNG